MVLSYTFWTFPEVMKEVTTSETVLGRLEADFGVESSVCIPIDAYLVLVILGDAVLNKFGI